MAGCNFTGGAFAPSTECGFPFVCCVPPTICGEEDVLCCNDMTSFRPACSRGQWICTIEGTQMRDPADCP
jgi:hypothetical protein